MQQKISRFKLRRVIEVCSGKIQVPEKDYTFSLKLYLKYGEVMIYVYARDGKFLFNLNQKGHTLTFELIKTVKYIRETDAVKKFTEYR